MKLNKLLAIGIVVSCSLSVGLYVHGAADNKQINNKLYSTVDSLEVNYPTIEDLSNNSPLIVKGKIISEKNTKKAVTKQPESVTDTDTDEVLYTNKVLKIQKVYKGEGIKAGDEIEIRTIGGELDNVVQISELSIENNKSYILFLKPSVYPVTDGAYAVQGGVQGKFELSDQNKIKNEKYKDITDLEKLELKVKKQ
ncbi:hypothetical protein [Bacillus sp. OAE603]|uniref:hypothetical protein n=1 Tax=Gottfriedia sp. OAE603 TaxID=2663872 RepID=UPI00178936FF